MRTLWRSGLVRVGLGAAAMGASLLALALHQALRVDDVPTDRSPSARGASPAVSRPSGYALDRVLAAVAKDPFHPQRRRPGARFRLPSDRPAVVGQQQSPLEGGPRLIGTAVAVDGGGFAMCAVPGGMPRIVRVGERIGEWTLQRVSPGAAEFVTHTGGTITVRVQKAGA